MGKESQRAGAGSRPDALLGTQPGHLFFTGGDAAGRPITGDEPVHEPPIIGVNVEAALIRCASPQSHREPEPCARHTTPAC
jgi:hypothetical protein